MQFSITIDSVCSGGNHLHCTLTAQGGATRQIVVDRQDLFIDVQDMDEVAKTVATLMRQRVVQAGATTNQQRKLAIESEPFYL